MSLSHIKPNKKHSTVFKAPRVPSGLWARVLQTWTDGGAGSMHGDCLGFASGKLCQSY